MALADQLTLDGQKIDDFTTAMATTIDSAVARIIAEMNKPNPDLAAAQAAADHISALTANLAAFNSSSAQKIIDAGVPPVVPPDGPVPEPPTPVEPSPEPTPEPEPAPVDPNAPVASRARR